MKTILFLLLICFSLNIFAESTMERYTRDNFKYIKEINNNRYIITINYINGDFSFANITTLGSDLFTSIRLYKDNIKPVKKIIDFIVQKNEEYEFSTINYNFGIK